MKKKIITALVSVAMVFSMAATVVPKVDAATAVVWDDSNVDISWIDMDKPMVALTFDDGPIGLSEDSNAKKILDVIEEYDAHCTFFYIGQNITESTEAEIKRAQSLGCEIGNHTWAHYDLTSRTAEQMLDDVNSTAEKLKEVTGLENFLVRPPYFGQNSLVGATIKQPLIAAQVDTVDWSNNSTEEIINKVFDNIVDGSIVLMHETMPNTAVAVETIIPELLERGYQLVTVSEMMKAKGVQMTSGRMYLSTEWFWTVDHEYVEASTIPSGTPSQSPETTVIPSEEPSQSPETTVTPSEEPSQSPETTVAPSEEPSQSPETTVAPSQVTGTYNVVSQWADGYQVEFTITNNSEQAISNWQVQFTLADEIDNVWCAKQIDKVGSTYTIQNADWNGAIQANGSTSFGFTVAKSGSGAGTIDNIIVTAE